MCGKEEACFLSNARVGEVTLDGASAKKEPPAQTCARARLRPKAQLTLPDGIKRALHVDEGDEIEFAVHEDGIITVRGFVSVPSDQAWFFTRERLAGQRQADQELAQGNGTVHGSGEAMFTHLGSLGSAGDLLCESSRQQPGAFATKRDVV